MSFDETSLTQVEDGCYQDIHSADGRQAEARTGKPFSTYLKEVDPNNKAFKFGVLDYGKFVRATGKDAGLRALNRYCGLQANRMPNKPSGKPFVDRLMLAMSYMGALMRMSAELGKEEQPSRNQRRRLCILGMDTICAIEDVMRGPADENFTDSAFNFDELEQESRLRSVP